MANYFDNLYSGQKDDSGFSIPKHPHSFGVGNDNANLRVDHGSHYHDLNLTNVPVNGSHVSQGIGNAHRASGHSSWED